MNLRNKSLLFIAQYAASYEGNFMKSLYSLENKLSKQYGCKVFFALPEKAKQCNWIRIAAARHKFRYINDNPADSWKDLCNIIIELNPDIIHTHFDGYDVPIVKALRRIGMEDKVQVVWHLHDHLGFMDNIVKKAYQVIGYLTHYGKYAKNVSVIGVGAEVTYFTNTWHKIWHGTGFKNLSVIPNAIDTSRISVLKSNERTGTSFLAFGGRNIQKRIDLLIDAASYLNGGGKNRGINIYITRGSDTDDVVRAKFGEMIPDWCHIVEQRENINELFEMADCFVSCSDAETFSYAVCEATIANMPVIQSNIDGTMWNAINPSTFVFKQGSVDSLVEAMKKYMHTDTKTLRQSCKITRDANLRKYGMEEWCGRVLHFYEQL